MGDAEVRLPGLVEEFADVDLGDARLDERVQRIVARLAERPDDSFPEQMETLAEREALYRFLANPEVTLASLLQGHRLQTHARMRQYRQVRVVHDTTDFSFEGDREGLGTIRANKKGFFAHFALAVGDGALREPLGVVGVRPYVRTETEARRRQSKSQRMAEILATPRAQKESSRWEKLAIDVASDAPPDVRVVHVMDQEADDFAGIAELQRRGLHFVVRGSAERRVESGATVLEALACAAAHEFRDVALNRRSVKASSRRHPPRRERSASCHVRWGAVTLRRGAQTQSDVPSLRLNVVHVFEPSPPEGEEPIAWTLFTSEPIDTLEQATEVVDHYRARWVIEEYFKALKTGCAFEKRQLTTLAGLLRALGLFIPTAWKLLALRHLGRAPDARPASSLFDLEQLLLLRTLLTKRKYTLAVEPSVRDAMLGIAALGGHIKNNGDPGWIVLGRGFMKFINAEEGWRAARRSDQS